MPWAASTLYLHDRPHARDVLVNEPTLTGHLFALDLPSVDLPPRFADDDARRLLAIRSPGRPTDRALLPEGFDWKPLDGVSPARLAAVRPGLAGASSRLAPPDKHLRWLEDLAGRVAGPVIWYQAVADEGAPEGEVAWVVDWPGERAVDGAPLRGGACAYTRRGHDFVRLDPSGPSRAAHDPLAAALRHLGVILDGPWFTPHRPGFDWDALRLG